MARHVRFVPDGSKPTGAIRSGFYERPPAFGGSLASGEADAEARSASIRSGLSHDNFASSYQGYCACLLPVPSPWRALDKAAKPDWAAVV